MDAEPGRDDGREAVRIREERPGDAEAVREVHDRAFAQPDEGRLVAALRGGGGVMLSLVAVLGDRLVGHILYSEATIGEGGGALAGAALGPMAVLPEHQRRGVGGRMIEEGNRRLRERACPFVVVVGHPGYYPRFGFEPAARHGVWCPWEVPEEVFMLLWLDRSRAGEASGEARYRPEFSASP